MLLMTAQPTHAEPANAALERLIAEHGTKIFGLALRLCGNRAEAEDLAQEVFLQAFRKWHTFEGRSAPSTWLYTITVRACRKRLKRQKHRKMPPLSEITPFGDHTIADLRGEHPLDRELRREATEALEQQIAALPPAFRLPLVLKDVLELSLEEVGDILGIKPQTAKTRVHRARMMLRRKLLTKVNVKPAPAPVYERQMCADLLRAKLEAMDKGRRFPLGQDVICDRCRAVFAEFDLGQDLCADLAREDLPPRLRSSVWALLEKNRTGKSQDSTDSQVPNGRKRARLDT